MIVGIVTEQSDSKKVGLLSVCIYVRRKFNTDEEQNIFKDNIKELV